MNNHSLCLILLCGVFFFVLSGCARQSSGTGTPVPAKTPETPAAVQFKTTYLESKDKGKKNWDLEAGEIKYNETTGEAELTQVRCVLRNESGLPLVRLSAPRGTADVNKQVLRFYDGVKAESSKGYAMKGKTMSWNGSSKKLYAKGEVVITKAGSFLSGEELQFDPLGHNIEVKGKVKVLWRN